MKYLSRPLAVAFIALGFICSSFAASAKVGMDAPDFTLTDIEGTTHTLSSFHGKTVVLEWVNPECRSVRNNQRLCVGFGYYRRHNCCLYGVC